MRKFALLTAVLALVAWPYGCDRPPNPLEPAAGDETSAASLNTVAVSPQYEAVLLESPAGFDYVSLEGIDNNGTIVGWGFLGDYSRPLVWEDGVPRELPRHVSWAEGYAFDINDKGLVVGMQDNLGGVLWRKDQWTDLGVGSYPYPAFEVWARALNENGRVVGEIYRYEEPWVAAFLWAAGQWSELPMLDGSSECVASDINASGQVVGSCWPHAVMWYKGGVVALDVGGTYSDATAINSKGQVVGGSSDGPFLWYKGETQSLQTYGGYSRPLDINDAGQIVGISWTTGGEARAVLWDGDQMLDLGLGSATAINNKGWIAGKVDGQPVLWKPLNH